MFVISQLSKSTNSLRAFNSPWRGKVPPAKRCKNPRDIPHSGDWGGGEYLVVIAADRNPRDIPHSGDWGGGEYLVVVAAVMNPWDELHSGDWGGGGGVLSSCRGVPKSLRHTSFRWLRVVFDSWRCDLKSYRSFYISRGFIPPYFLF